MLANSIKLLTIAPKKHPPANFEPTLAREVSYAKITHRRYYSAQDVIVWVVKEIMELLEVGRDD